MCTTKIHQYMKQYMPNKPLKWSFKILVLPDFSRYAYNFEVNSGQDYMLKRPIAEPDSGL